MLKLLLDEHISPSVAAGVRRMLPGLAIESLRDWEQGGFLGQPDSALLTRAHELRWTLVTYDLRTIAPLLSSWAEQGIDHGGVIFVHAKTLPSSEVGLLVRSIAAFARGPYGRERLRNKTFFLRLEDGK